MSDLLVEPADESAQGDDDVCSYVGPYPIINSTLNVLAGRRLAWQQRKAIPFTISPLYTGYHYDESRDPLASHKSSTLADHAYRATKEYGERLSLGTAMAISGAAASPSMGQHSSPPLSFLMTVFNVRLGWWLGNPRHEQTWRGAGPKASLFLLLSELFGQSNDRHPFVYLSDGGHFENLGLYELVRRRCRFIAVFDAGADDRGHFADLGNAIERCRTDLGVPIEIEIDPLVSRGEDGLSKWHCAIGRIRYDRREVHAQHGILVYVKPTLTGDEPADVLRYRRLHPTFPHHSTLNEWFDEARFESYRELGYHCTRSVFRNAARSQRSRLPTVDEVFKALESNWLPERELTAGASARYGGELTSIVGRIRQSSKLAFLDAQLFPAWRPLLEEERPDALLELPTDAEERREGFYMCQELIQLMENVYHELRLEEQHDHPDNRGWMNLFRHMAWSTMVRATWAATANTYGTRFQEFYRRQLGLDIGKPKIVWVNVAESCAEDDPLDRIEPHPDWTGNANRVEKKVVRSLLSQFDPACRLALLQLEVRHPNPEGEGSPLLPFQVGLALVADDGLRYIRIRDHLRDGVSPARASSRSSTTKAASKWEVSCGRPTRRTTGTTAPRPAYAACSMRFGPTARATRAE